MTGSTTLSFRDEVQRRPATWVRLLRRRLKERAFWEIQVMVLSITAAHVGVEAYEIWGEVGLHHLTVVLYLIPVVYAGLRYGLEGGLLTGAFVIVLTLPNIVIWHQANFEWAGEALRALVVTGAGVAVSVPVERERRQRRRLVETGRRLELLNSVSSKLVSSGRLDETLLAVLDRLRDVLGIAGVAIASWRPGELAFPLETWQRADPEAHRRLGLVLAREDLGTIEGRPRALDDGTVLAPLGGGHLTAGVLIVVPGADRSLGPSDAELFQAVAGQIGVALDNVRLQQQERDRLRSYVQGITRAHEDERRHLARELHDTVAQDLVRLLRELDRLAEAGGTERTPDAWPADLRTLAASTLEEVRRVGRDVRPTILDDLGLVPGLEALAAELSSHTGIEVRFRLTGDRVRLPAETELALYRIAQEALANVEKHSNASSVSVEAAFHPDAVLLVVQDDGDGFEPPMTQTAGEGRFGLMGMEERARLVGGTVEVRSRPGSGTTVTAEVRYRG